jgi:hypothetical protein
MSTINFTNSDNNANVILWSYSTKLSTHTDRKTSSHAAHAEIAAVENLGVGVTATDPFTILA